MGPFHRVGGKGAEKLTSAGQKQDVKKSYSIVIIKGRSKNNGGRAGKRRRTEPRNMRSRGHSPGEKPKSGALQK